MGIRITMRKIMIWTNNFAYGVGLLTTDGNLSKDGRHIIFVSKDLDQINNLLLALNIKCKISLKKGGYKSNLKYYFVQFSKVSLYKDLLAIGLKPNKSKILGELNVPDIFFKHFLRGCFDGDGYSYSYWDKRWKSSFLLYLGFSSSSKCFLIWLKNKIFKILKTSGKINHSGNNGYRLIFSKYSSINLIDNMYNNETLFLKRKRFKILKALSIINKQAGMLKLVDRHA